MTLVRLLASIFLAYAFSLCDGNNFVCQYHNEQTKSLEIYCDYYQKQLPRNCTAVNPSLNSSEVIRLKIEGCNQSDVCITSALFANIQQFDVSFSGYASLNCSGNEFEHLIDFIASFNELTAIPTKTLQQFPKLETLDLSHNYLTRVFNGDFAGVCRELRQINLSNNNLAYIDDAAFANMNHLELISLSYNRFSTLPTINYLHSTRDVMIRENPELTAIDCQFMLAMGRNRKVHLSWKYVKSFDGGKNCSSAWKFRAYQSTHSEGIFHSFGQLYHLFCNENGFSQIQTFVAGSQTFKNVRPMLKQLNPAVLKIDLSDNNVEALDAVMFERFQRLNQLILSNISLMEFDFHMLNVNHQNHLVRLDISKNALKVVENPVILQDFDSLIDFNAEGNRIKNADDMIRYLPTSIQRLNLADNEVHDINAISRLVALESLTLRNCKILLTETNPFITLRNLISLDISRNNFSDFNFAADSNIVESVDISKTIQNLMPSMNLSDIAVEITTVGSPFQTLSNLIYLNLSETQLQKFDLESLNPLKKLHTLDISHNRLQSINLKPLSNLTQLQRLYLNDNDLSKLDNFDWKWTANISLAIDRNNMPCAYLRQLNYENPHVKYIGDSLRQKHGDDCRSNTQGISDFLGSVYEKVKFW